MAFLRQKLIPKFSRFLYTYQIPERYRNSFYLANAAFFDSSNWFLHRAYELCFSKLLSQLQEKDEKLSKKDAIRKVLNVIEVLDQCNSIIDIRFPVLRDNGVKEIVRGFRAQHGLYSGFGTCLGGLRLKANITRDHMKALSFLSTYKHSCMGIRFSGAAGGIKIDPNQYSCIELQRIVKRYAAELYSKGYCDGFTDVIEPDINSGEREMAWIASIFPENYEKMMVVGKPPDMQGIENYSKMASQGAYFALDHFMNCENVLEKINLKPGIEQKTFIIQGIGTLGSALAKYLENSGAICVGIKEYDGYIYDPEGVDIQSVIQHRDKFGTIQNYKKAKPCINDEVFKEQCDILVLAAQQKSLICFVADKVKAKVIIEAANGSITPTSHRILVGRCKLVLPDIYVSSGHSVASYLEYLVNLRETDQREICLSRYIYKNILDNFTISEQTRQVVSCAQTQKIVTCEMKPDILTYAIDHVMKETGNDLLDIAKEFNLGLDLRTAGYIKAIQSIHDSVYDLKKY